VIVAASTNQRKRVIIGGPFLLIRGRQLKPRPQGAGRRSEAQAW
jgi:hypothetical protein